MPKSSTALAGTVLVASGAIGAGMFALPVVAAGMWTTWSLAVLLVVWAVNLIATIMLAKVNLRYPPGSSFNTIVLQELGPLWNAANNIAIWFVMAILLYAYFSASASIVSHTLSQLNINTGLTTAQSSLIFGGVVALLVWTGSNWVSKACGVLLLGMILSFSYSTGGLLLQIDGAHLFQSPSGSLGYMWGSLPYFVTAFACAGLVPSLIKHYRGHSTPVLQSLVLGTLITLLIYGAWLLANFGNINREAFAEVIQAGGNIGQLAKALQQSVGNIDLLLMLTVFSNLAVTTSFISIGLGLFDFITDRFSFSNTPIDRFKSAAICFAPPAVLSLYYPRGFVLAIGYAGIAVLFSFYLIPALMSLKSASKQDQGHKIFSTKAIVTLVILFAAIVFLCKVFAIFDVLSNYPQN